MNRFFSLFLALSLLVLLPSCGAKEQEPTVVSYDSISEVSTALGYELLAIEKNSTNLTFASAAVVDDVIGQVDYETGNSTVELRMTLEEEQFDGLAGFENAGKAGGIDAPSDVFSKLELYVVDETTYFCEFSYTYDGCTCYLSLAESKTNFDAYSILLINYVNQIYNAEEVPDFVYTLDPDYGREDTAAQQAASSQESAAESSDADSSGSGQQSEASGSEKSEDGEQAEDTPAEETDKAETDAAEETDKEGTDAAEETDEEETDTAEQGDASTIVLEYYDITLVNPGDSYTFSPSGGDGSYTWESADSSVATVSGSGTVTAVASGQTTVTCSSGGVSVDIIVRVP